MCLILTALNAHPDYRLVVAANRDEFYERPTAPLSIWDDARGVIAGRDLRGGGTWMGVTADGRFAAVTNYRDGRAKANPGAASRGLLVADYLATRVGPDDYVQQIEPVAYDGYNLLVGDLDSIHYATNRGESPKRLEPGIHGLSNALLNTEWPKVAAGKQALADALESSTGAAELETRLLQALADGSQAEADRLPDTGVGLELERLLSAIHIQSPAYGTRSSSVLIAQRDGRVSIVERQTHPEMAEPVVNRFEFRV